MLTGWKFKVLVAISVVFIVTYVFYSHDQATGVTLSSDLHFLQQSRMRHLHKIPHGNSEETETSSNDGGLPSSPQSSDSLTTIPSKSQNILLSTKHNLQSSSKEVVTECCESNKSGTISKRKSKHNRTKRIKHKKLRNLTDNFLPPEPSLSELPKSTDQHRNSKGRTDKPADGSSRLTDNTTMKRWIDTKLSWLSLDGLGNSSGFASKPYPPYLIKSNATFLDRVHDFNVAITQVKEEIEKHRGYREWEDVKQPNELQVIWGNIDDFLQRLADHKEVITLVLPWVATFESWSNWDSSHDFSNVLVREYFTWSASQPLCEWIETPGFTKAHWDAVYNRSCNTDVQETAKSHSLEWLYFHARPINSEHYWPNDGLSYPSHFYTSPPLEILSINILEDAVINLSGDIISGGIKVVPYTCSHDRIPTIPMEYLERPIYRDVFVTTQFWGTSYFHKMLEVMPRVAPYIEFLRMNPNIHIHAPEDHSQVSELLRVLGLNTERIVTGITRAKVVYLPQGTPCGFPKVHELQILSLHYRNYIRENLPTNTRNRLVLIKRSGSRRFLQQEAIEDVLLRIAAAYNLNFTLFTDNPSPSLHETMSIFYSALVIVGPHGAGLSNMVYSEPGTLVVEGVCNPPHVNMCFQFTAHDLGHRYHGIPSEGGCERVVSIAPETIDSVVRELIKVANFDMSN